VSTEHLWDTLDTGLVAAHEFGHMLGLFDEYTGGATDPAGELIDSTSIMGSTSPGAKPYARHYEGFRSWLAAKDPQEQFTVVPEPQTTLLVMVGILIIGIQRFSAARSADAD
jgi:M6 family metalloprotease-like protein